MKNLTDCLSKPFAAGLALAVTLTLAGHPALAGRGSSPDAIRSAIASNSVDAISAELERAERLICPVCVTMVKPLVDHEDTRVRRVATWWLSRHGQRTELFVQAAERLGQPDSRLAQHGADVLGSLRNERGISPLGAALNNPLFDAQARVAMADALGRIGEQSAIPALVEAMRAKDAPVRAAAIGALRELRGRLEPAPALPLLTDADENVRVQAVYTIGAAHKQALASSRATELVQALAAAAASDLSARVRMQAAWALGEIQAPASLAGPSLLRAANYDADASVRQLAQAALTKLAR